MYSVSALKLQCDTQGVLFKLVSIELYLLGLMQMEILTAYVQSICAHIGLYFCVYIIMYLNIGFNGCYCRWLLM